LKNHQALPAAQISPRSPQPQRRGSGSPQIRERGVGQQIIYFYVIDTEATSSASSPPAACSPRR